MTGIFQPSLALSTVLVTQSLIGSLKSFHCALPNFGFLSEYIPCFYRNQQPLKNRAGDNSSGGVHFTCLCYEIRSRIQSQHGKMLSHHAS